jgi:hypothetical protein
MLSISGYNPTASVTSTRSAARQSIYNCKVTNTSQFAKTLGLVIQLTGCICDFILGIETVILRRALTYGNGRLKCAGLAIKRPKLGRCSLVVFAFYAERQKVIC